MLYAEVILALKGVSMQIPEGGCVTLLGANGAGKSTTLKAISGVIDSEDGRVSGGAISFDGRPIHGHDSATIVRGGLVHVMEGRRVLPHMTVEQNLIIGGHMFPSPRRCGARSTACTRPSRAWPNCASASPATCRAASSRCW